MSHGTQRVVWTSEDRSRIRRRSIVMGCSVFVGFAAGFGCVSGVWNVRAEPPVLESMSTQWLKPGAETSITLKGRGLEAAHSLWTSFPASATRALGGTTNPQSWTILLKSRHDEGCGVLRWVGLYGVSEPMLVAWDKLPEMNLTPASDRGHATVIANEGRIQSQFRAGQTDWFRIPAAASNLVYVEIIAARLGSKADPYLEVWNDAGHRLHFQEDSPGLGTDVSVRLDNLPPGDKWIGVRDSSFGGGVAMEYWLRASGRPWGGIGNFEFSPKPDSVGKESAAADQEPNDGIEKANPIILNAAGDAWFRGRLERPGDQDLYRVRVPKAGKYVARGFGTSLGSPVLPRLKWLDGKGKWLSVSGTTGVDEASVEVQAQLDTDYFLAIDDWTGAGGNVSRYEIRVGPALGLRGTMDAVTMQGKPGETVELKVSWTFDKEAKGTFQLGILGERWAMEPSQVTVGQKETVIRLTLPKDITAGTIRHIRLGVKGESDENEVHWCVGTRSGIRRLWPGWVFPQPTMDGWIAVGLTD